MVYKCAASTCRSGYSGEKRDQNVIFHSFPLNNKQLLKRWLERLARKGYTPTKHSKLCSLHFKSEDFVTDSKDQKERRKRKRETTSLMRKRLKKDACPSIFKGMPSSFTRNCALIRLEPSSPSSRFENKAPRLLDQNEIFFNADKVENFSDLIEKLPEELQRQKYILHQTDLGADLIYLSDQQPSSILATVFINIDLKVTVYQNRQIVPSSFYDHIMSTNKVTMVSQVSHLLAFAKSLSMRKPAAEEQFKSNICKLINTFLLKANNEQQISVLKFVMEQIDLDFKSDVVNTNDGFYCITVKNH